MMIKTIKELWNLETHNILDKLILIFVVLVVAVIMPFMYIGKILYDCKLLIKNVRRLSWKLHN
jgi:hypothetical protein